MDMAEPLFSSLSEQNETNPQTAAGYNAERTGRIETIPDMPVIAPADNMASEPADQDISVQVEEQEPETTRGDTKRNMRLDVARSAIRILDTDRTLTIEQRLKLMATIEKLTSGRKVRKAKPVKTGIFSE